MQGGSQRPARGQARPAVRSSKQIAAGSKRGENAVSLKEGGGGYSKIGNVLNQG